MVKIVVGDECGLVKLVRLERETVQKWHTQSRSNGIQCLAWSGNRMSLHGAESTVSAALACGIVRTWDSSTMDRTHDTRNAPKDAVHLSTVGSHHMVLAAKGGSVRVFAKDAPSAADEDCDWLATSAQPMPDISAASTAPHSKGCLVAAGGRDSLLRVWDIAASSASAATGTPVFEARRQHSDWVHRSVPVWVSGVAFLGVRGPTPEGALPPMTMAALESRYDSDTDDSGDDESRRESVKELAKRAIRMLRGERAEAKTASARRKGAAGRWSHFAPAVGRQRLRLDSEDEASLAESQAASSASSARDAGAALPASDAADSAVGSTEEELEPWSLDTEMFPPAPSSVYEHLTDSEIKETMLRGAVLNAPRTRLPARDNEWRPTAGAPSSVILTVSRHKHVAIYDTRARRQAVMHKEAFGDWALTSCAADPLSYCAYVGDSIGNVSRLELRRNLRMVQRYHGSSGAITSIQMHETMPLLATTSLDRCMRVFHAETGDVVRRVYLKQRLSDCLFSSERRVKKPDYRREYDAQTDRLGLVVRVSCLKGKWRDGIEGKRYRTKPRDGEEDEPVEDDGVTEAELEAAGVGAGADQAGGQRAIRGKRSAGDDDDDDDDDAVWARLDKAAEAPENDDDDDDDDDEDGDSGSDGSDFDEELEADDYAAAAALATAGGGKHRRDEEDAGSSEQRDGGSDSESDGHDGSGKPVKAKRAKPAAASGYDSLGEDSIDDDDNDDDSSEDEAGSDDEDGTAHMRRLKHGDADMELVDDRKALKNARKEAVRGRKNAEKASRVRQLEQRRQERGANASARAGGRGARKGGRGQRR